MVVFIIIITVIVVVIIEVTNNNDDIMFINIVSFIAVIYPRLSNYAQFQHHKFFIKLTILLFLFSLINVNCI